MFAAALPRCSSEMANWDQRTGAGRFPSYLVLKKGFCLLSRCVTIYLLWPWLKCPMLSISPALHVIPNNSNRISFQGVKRQAPTCSVPLPFPCSWSCIWILFTDFSLRSWFFFTQKQRFSFVHLIPGVGTLSKKPKRSWDLSLPISTCLLSVRPHSPLQIPLL